MNHNLLLLRCCCFATGLFVSINAVLSQEGGAASETKWETIRNDDFAREEIGDSWAIVNGDWGIEDGKLCCKLTSSALLKQSEARIKLTDVEVPETVEVAYDTWVSEDASSELKLMDDKSSKGYIAALHGFAHPALAASGRKASGPTLWLKDPENRPLYEFIANAPDYDFKPGQVHQFKVLRDGDRLTLSVDGKEVVREKVKSMSLPILQLYGFGKTGDKVYFDNLRVRVPKK